MSTLRVNSIQGVSGNSLGLDVSTLNGGQLAGFRNQIINGSFAIWQRGEDISFANTTINEYAADRWVSSANTRWEKNNGNNIPGGALGVCRLRSLSVGQSTVLRQAIELPGNNPKPTGNTGPFVEDSQWTLSWYSKFATGDPASLGWGLTWRNSNTLIGAGDGLESASAIKTSTGIQQLEPTNTAGYARYGATITIDAAAIPSSATCLCVSISLSEVGLAEWFISNIQLEPGPVATPFEHRPIGTELALCQRYFLKIETLSQARGNGSYTSSTNGVIARPIRFSYPVTMRANPSLDLTGIVVRRMAGSGNSPSAGTPIGTTTKNFCQLGTDEVNFSGLVETYGSFTADAEL